MPFHAILLLAPLVIVMWVLMFSFVFASIDLLVDGKLSEKLKRWLDYK